MKKAAMILPIIILLITLAIPCSKADAEQQDQTIIYFYSPTCSTCEKIGEFLKDFIKEHNDVTIKKYNITDLDNKSLMNKYNEVYKVDADKSGEVPIIFIKDQWLTGEENIKSNLEKILFDDNKNKTIELTIEKNADNFQNDLNKYKSLNYLKVIGAGLVNGINPCSLSMLLFFISLIVAQEINIMKVGLSFCLGKFLCFLFLGSLFYSLLSKISSFHMEGILNSIFIIGLVILTILSIQDYLVTKKEQYGKVKLQLPKLFRKFNHDFMKKSIAKFNHSRWMLLLALGTGIIVTTGEFMCSGQIYLSSIITIYHKYPSLSINAFSYLVIYDIAYLFPLLVLILVIYKGKEVFEVSEVIREHLPAIKLIYAITFTIFAFILIFRF